MELEPLLATAIGHAAIQRHVAVVRFCGFIDGKLGLLGPLVGSKEEEEQKENQTGGRWGGRVQKQTYLDKQRSGRAVIILN